MKEKYYSISKISGSLFAEDTLVKARSSKEALEKYLNKKVIRNNRNGANVEYSVIESDEKGRLHYDKRKWNYYNIK
jgi:hypothetical protein